MPAEDDYILNETPDEDILPDEPIYDDENDYDQEEKPGIRDRYDDAKDKYERARDLRDRYERWKEKRQFKEADEAATQKPEQTGKQTPEEAKDLKGEAGKGAPETGGAKAGANKAPSDLKGEIGRPIPEGGAAGRAAGGVGRAAGGVGDAAGAVEGAGGVAGSAGAAAEGVGGTAATVGGGAAAWWVILIIVIILLVIALLMFAAGLVVGLVSGGKANEASNFGTYVGNAEGAFLYPSNCSKEAMAKAINDYILKHESGVSPLRGQGQMYVDVAAKYGLNPFLFAAQSTIESQFATTGYARNHPESHNPGGHKYGSWTKDFGVAGPRSPEGDPYMIYPNYEAALMAHGNILSHYLSRGINTLDKLAYKYMTGNRTAYVNSLSKSLNELFLAAGCSPAADGAATGAAISNSDLEKIITDSGFSTSDVAVVISGKSSSSAINPTKVFSSASSIKAALLYAYLRNNNVPTSGSSIDTTIRSMVTNSNNNSANNVLSAIGGTSKTTAILQDAGINGVRVQRTFGATSTSDNTMSAAGAVQLLQAISQLPEAKKTYAFDVLDSGDTGTGQDYIRQALGGAKVYSKSGQGLGDSVRNDIAIIDNSGNYSYIVVLVNTNSSNTAKAQQLIKNIAKAGIVSADYGSSVNCGETGKTTTSITTSSATP